MTSQRTQQVPIMPVSTYVVGGTIARAGLDNLEPYFLASKVKRMNAKYLVLNPISGELDEVPVECDPSIT